MPAVIYAVTFGSLQRFVRRVIKNPPKSISATEIIICDTVESILNFSNMSVNKNTPDAI